MKTRAMSETPYAEEPSAVVEEETGTLLIPQYHVVLLDDDDHSYDYVIEMLSGLFHHSHEVAYRMAREVDVSGRVIVATTYMERAEMKRDQIQSYGADWRIPRCSGSMSAIVEPAE
ncbi:MAG: ATP-dependent Clp protease adaptor ClpS [Ignavibacteria bacterium]|nr:ATP-dependent Clp protease adaptor ClpS [Ignavibacteria bacterium]